MAPHSDQQAPNNTMPSPDPDPEHVPTPPLPPPSAQAQTALYVGDLDTNVTESQLYEVFTQIGQVVSVRVCRDVSTKRSLGYAYVNYSSPAEASEAIQTLNFKRISGKPMRIMYSNRDPLSRRSGSGNVYIKNLDPSVDNKILHDEFSVYGTILSCRVATNANGESKGFGFVQFEQEEAAEASIAQGNGKFINGRQVFVGPFVRKEERDSPSTTDSLRFNNVYVKNFTDTTTDEELRHIFSEFGPITSAAVMRDTNGNSKCFGFVNFENVDDAARAVEALNGKKINEKEWYVGRAQKKSEREAELRGKYEQMLRERIENTRDVNLYIKNIDESVDDSALREFFSQCGTIASCKIMRSVDGQSKGIGFVTYSSPREAKKAVRELNGKMLANKRLYVSIAQRKEDRQQQQTRLQVPYTQIRSPMMTPIANQPPIYHPRAPLLGQQFFYSQPHPGLIHPQLNGFGYQQPMLPGLGPGGAQLPNFFMPAPPLQGPRMGRRGIAAPMPPQQMAVMQQQMLSRGSNRAVRPMRNTADSFRAPEVSGSTSSATAVSASSAPPSTQGMTPEQQRMILGERLYPLVDKLEHNRAGKVTGMLLELDPKEVLHLIESPEALRLKVSEAMDVLRLAQTGSAHSAETVKLANLSLDES